MRSLSDSAIRRLRDAADAPDLTGTKYEVLDRIGQGGMGTVYRARDLRLNRDVAVKLLHEKYAPNSQAARRFVDEARMPLPGKSRPSAPKSRPPMPIRPVQPLPLKAARP